MGEIFKFHKQIQDQNKIFRLSIANTEGWERHSDYHFSRIIKGKRVDWWPSTGTIIYNSKRQYGYNKCVLLLRKLENILNEESENKNE